MLFQGIQYNENTLKYFEWLITTLERLNNII